MSDLKAIPDGYSSITPYLVVEDATGFLDFLANAFGATERMRMPMPEGGIGHAEVEINGAIVMVSDTAPPDFPPTKSQLHLYVEDVDGAYARAVSAGAGAVEEPADQFYGDRVARVSDPGGNRWSIASHVEDVEMEEVMKRIEAMGED